MAATASLLALLLLTPFTASASPLIARDAAPFDLRAKSKVNYLRAAASPRHAGTSPSLLERTFRSLEAQNAVATDFTYPKFGNSAAKAYEVNTSTLPLFNGIPIQNSWAGKINTNNAQNDSLFFWYFPSSQKGGSNALTVWLNGGPGCSSLEGLFQENGPFNFLPGSTNPVVNPDAWTTVSDMLYVEQPSGVGFSTGGQSDLTGEVPLANDFYQFLTAYFKVFPELVTKKFFLSGESYAGYYLPYIAKRVVEASDAEKKVTPLVLHGLTIIDGVFSDNIVGEQVPTARFASQNAAILGLNSTFLAYLNTTSKACGYEALIDSVKYPQPKGYLTLPNPTDPACDVFDAFYYAALDANPCFNIYHITDTCPTPHDPLGGQDGNATSFLNLPAVQAALHVSGSAEWVECSVKDPFVNGIDNAPYTETIIPGILAKGVPVLLWHGDVDAVLFTGADYITIQNMTWGGVQGFTKDPRAPLYINGKNGGTWGAERNLTFIEVYDAGHMIPEYQPSLALAVFASFIKTGGIGNGSLTVDQPFTQTYPVIPGVPFNASLVGTGEAPNATHIFGGNGTTVKSGPGSSNTTIVAGDAASLKAGSFFALVAIGAWVAL